jgi:peptide/nickel transport system substrate-binding protein
MDRRRVLMLCLAFLLAGCAPTPAAPAPGPAPAQLASAPAAVAPAQPRAQKILHVAVLREAEGFVAPVTGAGASGGASQQPGFASNMLQNFDERGNKLAELAVALPSTSDGTWRINADGTMETIWKLRPNVKWHDGQPVTGEDLVFGYRVVTTPGLPTTAGSFTRNISEVVLLDPLTVAVRWKALFVEADQPLDLLPVLPKHLLEGPLSSLSPDAFARLPYWTTEYVGNGPFKLTSWERATQLDFAAFDDYYRGRPKIDRVILRIVPDTNTQIAGILSGDLDLLLPQGIDVDTALTIKDRWAGTANQVLIGSNGRLRFATPQAREEQVQPKALLDFRVRQALQRSMDRQAISEAISRGVAVPADGVVPPFYDVYKSLEPALVTYPYDVAAAQRMLQEVGWTKGSDGTLRNAQGEEFKLAIAGGQSARIDREMNAMAIGWKELGIQPIFAPFSQSQVAHEFRWDYPGIEIGGTTLDDVYTTRRSCNSIPSAANNWRGNNRSGFCSQELEAMIDRLAVTIEPDPRLQLQREIVRYVMTDASVFPMYWDIQPILAVASVKGVHPSTQPRQLDTFNSYQWDKE